LAAGFSAASRPSDSAFLRVKPVDFSPDTLQSGAGVFISNGGGMKILLAVDPSKNSEAAVNALFSQCRPQDGEVRVLHVLQPIAFSAAPQMAPTYTPEMEQEGSEAKTLVERVAGQLRKAGFRAEAMIAKGDVRETIVNAAAEWPADLIVVGSRGGGALRRLLLGSVAEFVTRHAPCSVLIARSPSGA
jgi:nucleotide-binding universal stress UspA family protein